MAKSPPDREEKIIRASKDEKVIGDMHGDLERTDTVFTLVDGRPVWAGILRNGEKSWEATFRELLSRRVVPL